MVARWIARAVGAASLEIMLSLCGLAATGWAGEPVDWERSWSDPPAPLPSVTYVSQETESQAAGQEADAGKDKKADNEKADDLDDILKMDMKELSQVQVKSASPAMNAEVSTVSRTVSSVGKSPAAVYVITNEMIRRSGARNLPEVLRLAPGVNVAQVNQHVWAISIRGFNGAFANKLLVQIDGRAVYTPGNGGVEWNRVQVLLEDVERIEVIRGPGGAVWGANAVNGIINIITKSSVDTHGMYLESGGGSEHRSFNAVRAGGQSGDLHWRMYGMQADNGPGYANAAGGAPDAWQYGQGGFHLDWTPTSRDTLTLQGDFLIEQETFLGFGGGANDPSDVNSTNFLGRWTRTLDDERDWSVQLYYDNYDVVIGGLSATQRNMNTFDLDSQYHAKLGSGHDAICGFGFRNYSSTAIPSFTPPQDAFKIISYFFQDTVELRPESVFLTAGVKLEHNDFTNFEYQPSIRLLLAPDDRTSIWGAISRAVRTPTIIDRDINLPGFVVGNKNVKSEDVLAYELGVRRQPTDRLYWDMAVFFNRYDNLVGVTPLFPPPQTIANVGAGDTYGYELVATYQVNRDWQLRGSYSFLVEDIDYLPNSGEFFGVPGQSPRNQFFLQSGWNLPSSTTLDATLRYVDNLAAGVPHYVVMDIRLAREFGGGLEAALVGQNLLDNHHLEFNQSWGGLTEVQSGVYGMVTWRH